MGFTYYIFKDGYGWLQEDGSYGSFLYAKEFNNRDGTREIERLDIKGDSYTFTWEQ